MEYIIPGYARDDKENIPTATKNTESEPRPVFLCDALVNVDDVDDEENNPRCDACCCYFGAE